MLELGDKSSQRHAAENGFRALICCLLAETTTVGLRRRDSSR
jgi:hypothetical protein